MSLGGRINTHFHIFIFPHFHIILPYPVTTCTSNSGLNCKNCIKSSFISNPLLLFTRLIFRFSRGSASINFSVALPGNYRRFFSTKPINSLFISCGWISIFTWRVKCFFIVSANETFVTLNSNSSLLYRCLK